MRDTRVCATHSVIQSQIRGKRGAGCSCRLTVHRRYWLVGWFNVSVNHLPVQPLLSLKPAAQGPVVHLLRALHLSERLSGWHELGE